MIKKVSVLISVLLAMNVTPAMANESTGYLSKLFINQDGLALFRLTNPVNQRPKCANNSDWDYKLDLSETYSRDLLAILKMAEHASVPVRVGYGAQPDCGKGFPAVNVHYIYLTDLYQTDKKQKGNYATGKK